MLPLLSAIAGPVVKGLFNIIDQTVEDKDQANVIKAKIAEQQHQLIETEMKGAIDIILAEAKGNWLQRSWRPMLMLVVITIVANNYVLVPYISMFTDKLTVLELPDGLWTLLVTGVGGYIVGRSGEKIAQTIKKPE
jgi:hypothetical protein